MSLADLKSQLPDYAKDLRLNLDSVLSEGGAPGLTQKQIMVVA
ncbi:MAG: alkyl hydroperoxide reductase, partial [Frateuria sp.]|nr:alkyl hydroperoxide reductase [Frateuria sp.]